MNKGTPALSQIIWLEQQIAALEAEMQVMSDKLTCALLEAKESAEIAPRREWVGLTEEEMETLYYGNADTITGTERNFGRAVEAALKEKNNG